MPHDLPVIDEQYYWYIATIGKTHGVRGLLTLYYDGNTIDDIEHFNPYYDTKATCYMLRYKGVKKNNPLIAVDGYNTKEHAALLQGTRLFIHKDTLPILHDDTVYVQSLMHYAVCVEHEPTIIGHITAWHDYGAGIILCCAMLDNDDDLLIAMRGWSIINIDDVARIITIDKAVIGL